MLCAERTDKINFLIAALGVVTTFEAQRCIFTMCCAGAAVRAGINERSQYILFLRTSKTKAPSIILLSNVRI